MEEHVMTGLLWHRMDKWSVCGERGMRARVSLEKRFLNTARVGVLELKEIMKLLMVLCHVGHTLYQVEII